MAEVNISINGRIHEISCDNGQEGRVVDLASYIDQRLQQIARSGAAYNDAHLMVLTALVIADELFETREKVSALSASSAATPAPAAKGRKGEAAEAGEAATSPEEEKAMAQLIEKLAKRIDGIAARVQAA